MVTILRMGGFVDVAARVWLHGRVSDEPFRSYASLEEMEATGSVSKFVRIRDLGQVPASRVRLFIDFLVPSGLLRDVS